MGRYVLKTAAGSQFMFNLLAGNSEVILTSELYTTKQGARAGIESVRQNSPHDARYQRKTAHDGRPYFVLSAVNGETIGTSELYSSTQARDDGIQSVKLNGPASPVDDQT